MSVDQNSRLARDIALLWPLFLATIIVASFFVFLFWVFSGKVDLKEAITAGLAGGAITQGFNLMTIVALHFYEKGRHIRMEDARKAANDGVGQKPSGERVTNL